MAPLSAHAFATDAAALAAPEVDAIAEARALFSPEGSWLNTATYGLPPRTAFAALQTAADEWRHGRCGFDGWDLSTGAARTSFARLHGVRAQDVAVGANVSTFAGMVAASLPAGAQVLAPEGDFTSLLFPLMAQQARGVRVELAPLDRLAEAIDARTDLVAFSAVQSSDGRIADLASIAAAARHHGARTLVDSTQASGWLPLEAGTFDYVVAAAYKWLLSPRGTAFMTVRPDALEPLTPHAAGWYAGTDPVETLYGAPLRLAADASRLDTSPAWLPWVGTAPALALFERLTVEAIHLHDVRLAARLREGLDLEPTGSAIVALEVDDAALCRLRSARVTGAGRDGRLRLSCHLYTTEEDVDRAVAAIRGR